MTSYVYHISKMADVESRFEAAVEVIRSMPKKGAYQPSHETMLKFYGYFKQAKEGPCTEPKPGFWDVVKKAKWEAWSSLGNLSKQDAMESYINELKKVVETMPDTEEIADLSSVLKSFYEVVYEPFGEEPPHILCIFKKPVTSPENVNGYDHSKDVTVTNSQSFDEESNSVCSHQNDEISLEKVLVSKTTEPHSNDKINGETDEDIQQYGFSNNSDNIINELGKTEKDATDGVNSLGNNDSNNENVNGSDLDDTSLMHDVHTGNTSLQPKPLYIVEVSDKKDLSLNKEDSKENVNDNVQNSQPRIGFQQSTDNGKPDSSTSDESEDEEFCDSLDPEHLSVLQRGILSTAEVKLSELNGISECHNNSTSTSSPDHLPGSSLTESDISDLENETPTSTNRYTSTPFEKKPVHVTFDLEEKPQSNDKDSDDRKSDKPGHVCNTSHGYRSSTHRNGGILKVKQAGSGYGGGDASKGLRQPPISSGLSQSRRHQGSIVGSNAETSFQDSRMIPGRSAGHSDSDSDDTSPNGESCDFCGERDEINERIMIALERLQQDMSRVLRRLSTMEDVMALRQERLQNTSTFNSRDQGPWWRQFIPSKTVAFLILWPFVINLVFYCLRKRKAHKS